MGPGIQKQADRCSGWQSSGIVLVEECAPIVRDARCRLVEFADYHFYHFSHRLPLLFATECDRSRRIAKISGVARIKLNHFPQRGLEVSRQHECVSFPSWTSGVQIPSPALYKTFAAKELWQPLFWTLSSGGQNGGQKNGPVAATARPKRPSLVFSVFSHKRRVKNGPHGKTVILPTDRLVDDLA